MSDAKQLATSGVVTFLDVLGWKGIYQRQSDPLGTLQRLVERLTRQLVLCKSVLSFHEDARVKTISDTIAIFTHATESEATSVMDQHAQACGRMIPLSIQWGIPLRGAMSFGDFDERENMFVGKAVDEAASWYESADWIGIHMTPSAALLYPTKALGYDDSDWRLYTPPFTKGAPTWETPCVDWPRLIGLPGGTADYGYPDMLADFRQLGPIIPEITGKFTNTMKFWDTMMNCQRGVPCEAPATNAK